MRLMPPCRTIEYRLYGCQVHFQVVRFAESFFCGVLLEMQTPDFALKSGVHYLLFCGATRI